MAIETFYGKPNPKGIITEDTGPNSPKVTEFEDGSVEYDFEPSDDEFLDEARLSTEEHYENLAELLSEDELNIIAENVIEQYDGDLESRSEWLETVTAGMNLLGIRLEETDDPFPGACAAHHPLILESAVKFQAKASHEMFSSKGPVKTRIVGKVTDEKEEQATRVRQHMNYQVMEEMEEYFDEMENMLFYLPIVGSSIKKTYYDRILGRPTSVFIPIDQFVVNYHATNLKNAFSFTHLIYRSYNDYLKDVKAGLYMDVELGEPVRTEGEDMTLKIDEEMGFSPSIEDEVFSFIEHYTYLDLPGDLSDPDGIGHPYTVTVDLGSRKVISIRRNWQEDDPKKERVCPFSHYKFVPGMGFYGLGYIHLLGNIQITLTSAMRSLIDAGTFTNLQAGFVDKRLRVRSNDGPFAPGEFREAEAAGIPLKDAIFMLPFKEPSGTLLTMFQNVNTLGQKFADSTEQVIADSTNYGPVGTTMALIEASEKFFSGVHKRLHNSQKHEFKTLARINYEYLEESTSFNTTNETFEILRKDYDGTVDILPESDPNMSSQAQRMTQAQTLYTSYLQAPQMFNGKEVSKEYFIALGIDSEKIDKFIPPDEEPEPSDPITDILKVQQGKPIAAFPGQDHQSHIGVKQAFLSDPNTGANPMMANLQPVIQANIQEHMIMQFQEQVAGTTQGMDVPPNADEKVQGQIISQAAQKVAEQNQQIAELQAQSPDEARNKLADADLFRAMNESRKLDAEMAVDQAELSLKALQIEMDKIKENNKLILAGMREEGSQVRQQMADLSKLVQEVVKMTSQEKIAEKNSEKKETLTLKDKGVDKEKE